jgi:hypothetical protein
MRTLQCHAYTTWFDGRCVGLRRLTISNDDDKYVQTKVTTFYRAKNDLGQLRICRDYSCRNHISHGAKTVGVDCRVEWPCRAVTCHVIPVPGLQSLWVFVFSGENFKCVTTDDSCVHLILLLGRCSFWSVKNFIFQVLSFIFYYSDDPLCY